MKRRDAAVGRCPCWKFNPEARDPDTPASTPDQPTEIAHRRLSTDSPGEVTGRHNSKSLSQSREIYDQVPRSLCSRSAGCGASRPSRDVSASARSKAGPPAKSRQRLVTMASGARNGRAPVQRYEPNSQDRVSAPRHVSESSIQLLFRRLSVEENRRQSSAKASMSEGVPLAEFLSRPCLPRPSTARGQFRQPQTHTCM
jgi:hypothetical protein